MKYLLLMTFSGSALFIGYSCWERACSKFMTEVMKRKALVMVLLTYLMPWIFLKDIYRHIFGLFWREERIVDVKGLVNFAEIRMERDVYRTIDYRIRAWFMIIWFTGAILFMLLKAIKYLKRRQELHALAIECGDENLKEEQNHVQKEIGCRRKPKIVWTRVDNDTLTLGAIKPIIFLQRSYDAGDLPMILKHEMIHIVRWDLLVKLMMEFVCCLHWFNPLVYLLARKLEFVCESSCDERVVREYTENERKMYIELLDKNKAIHRHKAMYNRRLEKLDEQISKRIELIRKMRVVKGRQKVAALVVFALMVFFDSLTAFAYPTVRHIKNAMAETAEDAVGGQNFWLYDYTEEGYDFHEKILYDRQFIDETGQIHPITATDADAACSEHNLISGYIQNHIKDENGGCKVEIYEGVKCTTCGMVWEEAFYSENSHTICTHSN